MGSPETVYVSHKAKALCYNTVSLLPVRLIRAPVLKPRPRSQAGGSAANVCLTHLPAVPGRFVGAAYMPPGRGVPSRGVPGWLPVPDWFIGRGAAARHRNF